MESLEGVAFAGEGLDELVVDDFESDGDRAVSGWSDNSFTVWLDLDLVNLAEWTGDLGNLADDDFGGGLFRLAKYILEMTFQTEMRRFLLVFIEVVHRDLHVFPWRKLWLYKLMYFSWKI